MQNYQNKTNEEKRREAREALEGEARKKEREAVKQKEIEQGKKRLEENQRIKEEQARKKKEEEEALARAEKEEVERKEKKRLEEEQRKALEVSKKEALLKKIRPRNTKLVEDEAEVKKTEIKRVFSTKNKSKIPQIRTYRNDIAETVKKQDQSLVKIAIQERKKISEIKTEKPFVASEVKQIPNPIKTTRKVLFVSIGVVIVLFSGGALLYQLNSSRGLSNTKNNGNVLSRAIIKQDKEAYISLSKKDAVKLASMISRELKETSGIDSIKNIYITDNTDNVSNSDVFAGGNTISAGKLFSVWKNNTPSLLKRALSDRFMVGIYSSSLGINAPFLVLNTRSYERAFAGMFAWEKTIVGDFYGLFGISKNEIGVFRDGIIDGKDVRITKDDRGKIILVYSFVNKNTIIITANRDAFSEIFSRLNK